MKLYTYKPINDRVIHDVILHEVEAINSPIVFTLLTDNYVQSMHNLKIY